MNPKHRDRIAFLRVLSGRFERGMEVQIGRNKEKLKLSKPHTFMAQERAIVEEAWPGDIVGLYDPGKLRIGDTVASGKPIRYGSIPGSPRLSLENSNSKIRSSVSSSIPALSNSLTRALSSFSIDRNLAGPTQFSVQLVYFSSRFSRNVSSTSTMFSRSFVA